MLELLHIIYVDETGFNIIMKSMKGYQLRNKRLKIHTQTQRAQNYSMVSAVSRQGFLGCILVRGAVNSNIFFKFLNEIIEHHDLYYTKYCFIFENVPIHRKHFHTIALKEYIPMIFLQPYSAENNIIELIFSRENSL